MCWSLQYHNHSSQNRFRQNDPYLYLLIKKENDNSIKDKICSLWRKNAPFFIKKGYNPSTEWFISFLDYPSTGNSTIIEITLFYERIKWSKPLKRRVYLESTSGPNGEIYRLESAEKKRIWSHAIDETIRLKIQSGALCELKLSFRSRKAKL